MKNQLLSGLCFPSLTIPLQFRQRPAILLNCALHESLGVSVPTWVSRQAGSLTRLQINYLSINHYLITTFDSLLNFYMTSVKIMFPFHSMKEAVKARKVHSEV